MGYLKSSVEYEKEYLIMKKNARRYYKIIASTPIKYQALNHQLKVLYSKYVYSPLYSKNGQ